MRFRLGLPALILTCNLALADDFRSVSPDEVLAASPNLTYLDLLRLVVPDVAKDGEDYVGHEMIEIRHAGGDESAAQPEDPIKVGTVSAVALDTSHVLLLADLGQADDAAQDVAPLALFDTADGRPKLVDAVDVGFDRFTSPAEPALLDLGPDRLALTYSTHWNAGQSYLTTAMLRVGADRIEPIDSIFTFSDMLCAIDREQTASFATKAGENRDHSDIVVTVTEVTTPTGNECGDEPEPVAASTRTIVTTYRWDMTAKTYSPDNDALNRLEAENFERL